MNRVLKTAAGLAIALALGTGASAANLKVDGALIATDVAPWVINHTTYVSLRAVAQALRADATLSWEGCAAVRADGLVLTAAPGARYIEANGRAIYVGDGVRTQEGRTLVPIRALGKALDAKVHWNPDTGDIELFRGSGAIAAADRYYNPDDLYWLSRIISAESQGEPLGGKIAVGNVILNRVSSSEFPDSVYGVIFDSRWGGQFTPVRNGTIYHQPTAESVLAAKLVLDGANTAGKSLYFLAPQIANNHWVMENRPYVTTIGSHWFYR